MAQKYIVGDVVMYDNGGLFSYHHVLTGSCRMGRESFVSDRGLSLDGKT